MGFTKKEKNFIIKNYSDLPISKIADILNCPEKDISNFLITQDLKFLNKEKKSVSVSALGNFDFKYLTQVFSENVLFWISIFVFVFLLFYRSFNGILLSDELTMYTEFQKGNLNPLYYIYGSGTNHYWALFLFGINAWGNRFISIILHLINIILFYTIFRNFISERILKISVLLISVHSLFVESITWVAANPYIYHGFIYLLIMYFSLIFERTGKKFYLFLYYLLVINFTISGGHVNYAPILAIIFNLFILKRSFKREFIISFWLLLFIPVFAFMNRSTIESRVASLTTGPYLEKYVQTLPFTTAKSLELVFIPYNLALFHEETLTPIYYTFARILTLVFFGLTFYLLFKKEKIYFGLVGIACAYCIYIFSPVQIAWFVAERYLYFPIFIACIFLAFFIDYLNKHYFKIGYLLLIFYFFFFLFITFFRFNAWDSMTVLWIENSKTSPDSYRVRNNLAESYLKEKDFENAEKEYLNAIKINPNFAEAYFNLSNAYLAQSKVSEAETYLNKSLELNPSILEAYVRLAIIYADRKDFSVAFKNIEKALQIDPNSQVVKNIYEELKKYEAQQKN